MSRSWSRSAAATLVAVAVVTAACSDPVGRQVDSAPVAIPGVAATPPMGWNSWNTFGCSIDEATVRRQADALVSSGMAAAGYRYVVVDDCWYSPTRSAAGRLSAARQRFPSGMAALGDYLHARGLLFGIYTGASDRTCAQLAGVYPGTTGSRGHERADAETFASWGVDYVKDDWCSPEDDLAAQRDAFVAMRDAIRATRRPMVFGINPNSGIDVAGAGDDAVPGARRDWGGVATTTRLTNDISPVWRTGVGPADNQGIADIATAAMESTAITGPGRWRDLDMLEVGVGTALTPAQQRTHLALWAMSASPLIAGNDVSHTDSETAALLASPGVIAVDQDPAGSPVRALTADGSTRARAMADGSQVVTLTNFGVAPRQMSVDPSATGAHGWVRDVWTGRVFAQAVTPFTVTVAPGDTAVYRIG